MSENKVPYSYHTFLFPFIWKTDDNININDFENILSLGKRWNKKMYNSQKMERSEFVEYYAAYQYFTEYANNVIFQNKEKNSIVNCYECSEIKHGDFKYCISKNGKEYSLDINDVTLNVYELGIAILSIELENYNCKSLDDVNAINEYGRRINMPYLMVGKSVPSVCADSIFLKKGDEIVFPSLESYIDTCSQLGNDFNKSSKSISFDYVMKPIQFLLDGNEGTLITSYRAHYEKDTNNYFYIKPASDDRMFVCCIVMDEKLSDEIKDVKYSDNLDEKIFSKVNSTDENALTNKIYKYCYIENELTCHNANMRKEILDKSIYKRWLEYGTLHGITHHSFVCITGNPDATLYSVVNPFLYEYVQLCKLVLLQRTAILLLSNEASVVANNLSGDLGLIRVLQEKYVKTQNQILLSEVTVQEQGVELYQMLLKQLYINENKITLDEQMNNLRDMSVIINNELEREADKKEEEQDKKLEEKITLFTIILTIVAILPSIVQTLDYCFNWEGAVKKAISISFLVLTILIPVISIPKLLKKD